jgi:hypothetical protein
VVDRGRPPQRDRAKGRERMGEVLR